MRNLKKNKKNCGLFTVHGKERKCTLVPWNGIHGPQLRVVHSKQSFCPKMQGALLTVHGWELSTVSRVDVHRSHARVRFILVHIWTTMGPHPSRSMFGAWQVVWNPCFCCLKLCPFAAPFAAFPSQNHTCPATFALRDIINPFDHSVCTRVKKRDLLVKFCGHWTSTEMNRILETRLNSFATVFLQTVCSRPQHSCFVAVRWEDGHLRQTVLCCALPPDQSMGLLTLGLQWRSSQSGLVRT